MLALDIGLRGWRRETPSAVLRSRGPAGRGRGRGARGRPARRPGAFRRRRRLSGRSSVRRRAEGRRRGVRRHRRSRCETPRRQHAAKAAGVPVNVADRPALSDFIMPAIIDRDDVVVAISTGGSSPTLATHPARPHRGGVARALRRAGAARQDVSRPGQCADRRAGGTARLLAPAGRRTGRAPCLGWR